MQQGESIYLSQNVRGKLNSLLRFPKQVIPIFLFAILWQLAIVIGLVIFFSYKKYHLLGVIIFVLIGLIFSLIIGIRGGYITTLSLLKLRILDLFESVEEYLQEYIYKQKDKMNESLSSFSVSDLYVYVLQTVIFPYIYNSIRSIFLVGKFVCKIVEPVETLAISTIQNSVIGNTASEIDNKVNEIQVSVINQLDNLTIIVHQYATTLSENVESYFDGIIEPSSMKNIKRFVVYLILGFLVFFLLIK